MRRPWPILGLHTGPGLVNELGAVGGPAEVFSSGADVFFVGSKMGAVNHEIAAQIQGAAAVVACGRIPVTARALAVLRRGGVAVPADFVALAGSALALWGGPWPFRCRGSSTPWLKPSAFSVASSPVIHDGPFLAACRAAESYLLTWQDELPFGRPLAP